MVRFWVEKDPFIFYVVAFVRMVIGGAILFTRTYKTSVKYTPLCTLRLTQNYEEISKLSIKVLNPEFYFLLCPLTCNTFDVRPRDALQLILFTLNNVLIIITELDLDFILIRFPSQYLLINSGYQHRAESYHTHVDIIKTTEFYT